MDCRQCEWLLCEVCCPRSNARPSFWGTISQLPYYAIARIDAAFDSLDAAIDSVDVAFDEFTERHAPTFTRAIEAVDKIAPGAGFLINPFEDDDMNELPL